MKTKVAVLFGGKSVEHEVSIISGLQAFAALDREKYDPIIVYITKDGCFYTGEGMDAIEFYRDLPASLQNAVRVLPVPAETGVELVRYPMKRFGNNVVGTFEVALPVVHGTNVEDGTLMGYLEMLGVPYASCDVTASALGMDKYAMKAVLKQAGIPVLDATELHAKAYADDADGTIERLEAAYAYPMIVKPVNLGSSVGISKAGDRRRLQSALELAFDFSPRVLVETAVTPLREINCAVLGDSDEAIASACEEPFGNDEILSFGDKYLSGGKGAKDSAKSAPAKSGGMSSLKRKCPADISEEMTKTVQELAVKTFHALGCSGVSRIDFLMKADTGELWVNEINTIPGSLSFYLWEETGLSFSELLDRMIAVAFKRQRMREALTFTYDSNILAGVSLGSAKGGKA
ncbi:MAG: D-alanine--D-alanine ligase [Clostridia bacterium]|nr:D-alanine--D-alanine ligase [Clostridia bacterium]